VPVDAGLLDELRELSASCDGFVLPGESAHARQALVQRQFAGWMRRIGWDRREYPKAAHELRKLCGSRWFTELGPAVAQEWLGHKSVATTCAHYARLVPGDVQPLGREQVG